MTAELVCQSANRDDWIKARRTGVTATDIVTILGLGWSSEYALYWEKLGKLPEWEGSARTRLGQELEPYIIDLWAAEQDTPYAGPVPGAPAVLVRNTERSWQLATPDRVIRDTADTQVGVLEVKTWDDHDRAAWEDGVPPRVRAQVLWQMDTLGVGTGHVGVLFLPSGEFESRTIIANTDAVHEDIDYMRRVGEAFWARVREGFPPFPDGSPATLAAVKALHPGDPTGSVEISEEAIFCWLDTKDSVAAAKEVARQAEVAMRLELGNAEVGTRDGVAVVKRTRYEVAGKTIERKAYTVDKLTRLGARNGDSDE